MEQMIFSDSQTSVTKLDWRVSGIPISDTRDGQAPATLYFPSEYDATYSRVHVFCQRGRATPLFFLESRGGATFLCGSFVCMRDACCFEPRLRSRDP